MAINLPWEVPQRETNIERWKREEAERRREEESSAPAPPAPPAPPAREMETWISGTDAPDEPIQGPWSQDEEIESFIDNLMGRGENLIGELRTGRESRRGELAGLLAGERERVFSEEAPWILEQLSQRGLLHSSATGEALTKEQSRLQQISEEVLGKQELTDLDYEQDLMKSLFGMETDIRTAGIEREFSLEDWEKYKTFAEEQFGRESDLAKEIANMQANAMSSSSKTSMWGDILGTGAGIGLSALLFSSRSFKEEIKDSDVNSIDLIKGLHIVTYKYKQEINKEDKTHIGIIAEDSPDIITTKDKKMIELGDICGVLLDANKKLIARIEKLEKKEVN